MVNAEECIRLSNVDVKVKEDSDKFNTPLITSYRIVNTEGEIYNIEASPIGNNTSFRFARVFSGGYTEMFDQMVIMKNIDTGELGTGIAELLRSHKSE
jgi:hypothetical protein